MEGEEEETGTYRGLEAGHRLGGWDNKRFKGSAAGLDGSRWVFLEWPGGNGECGGICVPGWGVGCCPTQPRCVYLGYFIFFSSVHTKSHALHQVGWPSNPESQDL